MTAVHTWRQIATTLDAARTPPSHHHAEVARHLAGFPKATLRRVEA